MLKHIKKRDGKIVKFEKEKIVNAIFMAGEAVGKKNRKRAEELAEKVVKILRKDFATKIPSVEDVQDIVEKVLIKGGDAKTAKAYVIYREQHKNIRETARLLRDITIIDDYLKQTDWRVRENSNMVYSLQGLNFHISQIVVSNYWLNNIYPKEVRNAHINGEYHIHDIGILGPYCVGWDLRDILISGFKGVVGKIESKPAKHFNAALMQVVNFLYTVQGESAGAQALSNFDTMLAPFIKYDNLGYKQVKQSMQEFLFNMNIPTRVGFQCMSEDTEILTPHGWKTYEEVGRGDIIKTFNIKKGIIEDKRVKNVFKKKYTGVMYNLQNRIQDQLISPNHRVVRKKFQSNEYVLESVEDVMKLKSPFIVPIAGKNIKKDINISDEKIKLTAWVVGEGSIEKPGKNYRSCYRINIYQSKIKNPKNYKEIKRLLSHFKLKYSEYTQRGLGNPVQRIRLNAESSRKIHQWFDGKENIGSIPETFLNMSQRQSDLFINTYIKAEGFENRKIATSSIEILNSLQMITTNAGYGSTILKRKPTIGTKTIYVLRLIKHNETYINKIKKINYSGVIWCPNTENETVIARRNRKVFITGNTPFTNVTLDLNCPGYMKEENIIIGGQLKKEKYKDFQNEMNLFNKAFAEVMLEGDAKGRPFTFPIPTYNITKDFDWDNKNYDIIWEITAKYGSPYFSNFINSDMSPDDVRSMCCRLRINKRELKKRGGGLFGSNPLTGSIGVVTINMPRIGYKAKNEHEFFKELDRLMELAKESLIIKRKILESFTQKGLYPYSMFYLRNIKKGFKEYWKNHFSTIGLIGVNDSLLNFKNISIADKDGKDFAEKILDFMRKKLADFQEETGDIFNLEATPAEGASYRLAKIDKKKYPNIKIFNQEKYDRNSEPYYTNSTQLPVGFSDDIFEVLELQDNLQTKYTGGTVLHGFLGEKMPGIKSTKSLVRKIAENFRIPYFTITPTFSICPDCGYISGEHKKCPKCGKKCEVWSRPVGYLRPVEQWNKGKQTEFNDRKTFDKQIKDKT